MTLSAYAKVKFNELDKNYGWTKLFELFPASVKVLDVGCSSGNFGKTLIKEKQCTVVGIDINEDDLKTAAKNLTKAVRKNIEQDDLSDLGTFDYILMADIIEHVIDPISVLKKIKKLLSENGKLVFSVPNMANIANRIELLGGRFEYTEFGLLDETHLHYYDRIEFEKVMNLAGFKVKKYNNTIRDVPKQILLDQLKKVGLNASPKFIKMTNDLDAITFQFIGVAEPLNQKLSAQATKVQSTTPHDFVSQKIDEMQEAHNHDLEELRNELKNQKQAYQNALEEKQKLNETLDAIKNSKGWRILTKMYAAKRKTKKIFHGK